MAMEYMRRKTVAELGAIVHVLELFLDHFVREETC